MTVPAQGASIVLCCAAENRGQLGKVIESLGRAGHPVELLSGVDLDSSKLEAAIRRRAGGGLYVVCKSDELDVYQIARLTEVFDEQGVAKDRVLMVDFSPGMPTEIVDPILGRARTITHDPDIDDMSPPSAGLPMWKVVIAAAAGVGVGALVLVVTCGPRDSVAETDTVASSVTSTKDDEGADGAKKKTEPEPAKEPAKSPEPAAASPEPEPEPAPPAVVEPTPAPTPETAPPIVADATQAGADTMIDEVVLDPSAAGQDAAIEQALAKRQIRALDILLVQRFPTRRSNYEAGRAYCEKLDIGGVTGWRMPTVGEINSITSAGLIKKDLYWTLNKGDTFGDEMLVWSAKRKRIRPHSRKYRGVRTACVRTRDGTVPSEAMVADG
jgi:hypothetical protein